MKTKFKEEEIGSSPALIKKLILVRFSWTEKKV